MDEKILFFNIWIIFSYVERNLAVNLHHPLRTKVAQPTTGLFLQIWWSGSP